MSNLVCPDDVNECAGRKKSINTQLILQISQEFPTFSILKLIASNIRKNDDTDDDDVMVQIVSHRCVNLSMHVHLM